VIALNTFREAVRNKIFYTLLFFAFVFAAFSVSLSTMVLGDYTHVLINMGLANIEIFGTLIAIFVGIFLVYKELERRTIYTIISRPIRRWQFILGKYLGLLMTLLLEVAIMSAVFFAILAAFGDADRIPKQIPAIWLALVKLMLITAVAVLFSSFSTPILSGMFTLAFWVVGSISGHLATLVEEGMPAFFPALVRVLQFILPDFRFLDIKALVLYDKPIPWDQVIWASAYGLMYTAMVLALSVLIFDRRDMK
jgi:ABC-type transport system involved in multi-copper enzyme maturation permease subunit